MSGVINEAIPDVKITNVEVPNLRVPNVRSSNYTIIESRVLCLHCIRSTVVFAFSLPKSYETLTVDEDDVEGEHDTWESPKIPAILSYVTYLSETVADQIRARTPHYRPALDEQTDQNIWMNHCEHCGEQVGEEELHGDLDGPFGPIPSMGLDAIKLYEVRDPFEAWAAAESHDLSQLDS